jgi:hypothetical protein
MAMAIYAAISPTLDALGSHSGSSHGGRSGDGKQPTRGGDAPSVVE